MASLICGSLAYDKIMTFEGRFREHILPDQIHILNLSFLVPTMREEFGGCAGNIAYALSALGGEARVVATLGATDGQRYLDRLDALGLTREYVKVIDDMHTAQAMVTTDLENNQITAFHPGAMQESYRIDVGQARGVSLGIVAPDSKRGMCEHARQFHAAGIPFIFDPGQGLPLFNGAELTEMIDLATYLTVNDYEARLVANQTGMTLDQLSQRVEALIVTKGEHGAQITHGRGKHTEEIPAVHAAAVVDPTGCGDAYRGGLLYGLEHGLDWATTGRLASLLGSLKIATQGPQNYTHDRAAIFAQFKDAFGYSVE